MSSEDNANYLIQVALDAGITSRAELAHFMGQMEVECGGFVSMNERLGYRPERLLEVFPGRNGMDTRAEAEAIVAGGRENIANAIYGGAWGALNLGNTEEGDGWMFHGRGYVQLTGRTNYANASTDLGLDLTNHPELAAERGNAANIAIHYWQNRVVPNAHQLNVSEATRDINGGQKHLPERRAATQRWAERFERGYLEDHGLVERPRIIEEPTREPGHAAPAENNGDARQRMMEEDTPRDTAIPIGSVTAPRLDPLRNEALEASDPLLRNIRGAVGRMETSIGKQWDDNSDRLSASLYGLAREKGFDSEDRLTVVVNEPTSARRGGEIVFLQRSGPNASPDPFANRANMSTQDALANAPDVTLPMVAAQEVDRAAQLAAQQADQSEQKRQGEPSMVRS